MSTSNLLLPSPTLRMSLWTDAAVSGAAGALQLAGGDTLAAAFGLPASLSLASGMFLPCVLDLHGQRLSLFTTLATFGSPRDVTLAELTVELFYPADAATEAALRAPVAAA